MFFGKSERKKSSVLPIMIVGALALVGAVSVTHKGKSIIKGATSKVKSLMGKGCDMVGM
jgi:hypothetical protein